MIGDRHPVVVRRQRMIGAEKPADGERMVDATRRSRCSRRSRPAAPVRQPTAARGRARRGRATRIPRAAPRAKRRAAHARQRGPSCISAFRGGSPAARSAALAGPASSTAASAPRSTIWRRSRRRRARRSPPWRGANTPKGRFCIGKSVPARWPPPPNCAGRIVRFVGCARRCHVPPGVSGRIAAAALPAPVVVGLQLRRLEGEARRADHSRGSRT